MQEGATWAGPKRGEGRRSRLGPGKKKRGELGPRGKVGPAGLVGFWVWADLSLGFLVSFSFSISISKQPKSI